jgi:hypothetical protein
MASRGEYGAFVPTTQVWDIQTLYNVNVNSPEFKDLLVRLYQNVNLIANVLNIKDSGYYVQDEFVCGQVFYSNPSLNSSSTTNPTNRQVFRKVVNFGALPDTGTKRMPHGIPFNASFSITRFYAAASNPTSLTYIPIPYASNTAADVVEMYADDTYVYIITASTMSAYTICNVIIEYIKQ